MVSAAAPADFLTRVEKSRRVVLVEEPGARGGALSSSLPERVPLDSLVDFFDIFFMMSGC